MAVAAHIGLAALLYSIALAGGVAIGCAAPGFSCHARPDLNFLFGAAMVALAFFATGLALMGGVLAPAAMLLRRKGWLYWWSALPIAAATAVLPLIVVCGLEAGNCRSPGFVPMSGSLIFASLCGGLFLWWSWLRHQASQPAIAERLARQPPAVKSGLIFVAGYVAVVAAAIVFVATSSGDMSGLVFLFITLPWPFVGSWLLGDIGLTGGLLLGLAINAAISFSIGYGLAKLKRRNEQGEL